MTIVSEATSLADAITAWQPMLAQDPEGTWFFCENDETVRAVLSSLHTPVLRDHVTTLRSFARKLVAETYPEVAVLTFEEQTAIVYHIIKQLPWGKKTRSLPIALASDLIGRYHFFRENYIDLTRYLDDKKKPKHQLLATIFSEYENYCGDAMLDSVGVLKKAIEILNTDNPVRSGIVFHIQANDLLTQMLLDAVSATRNVREFKRPQYTITPPDTLQEPMLKYRTAKEEIEATLEAIATLLEAGTSPDEILILSPKAESSARLIGSCIGDFYYHHDTRTLPLNCEGLSTPLSSFPIVQCVTAALSAVLNRRFALEDLQTVVSSPYFPEQDLVSLDELTRFAITASVSENEFDWTQGVRRMETDPSFAATIPGISSLIGWLNGLNDEHAGDTFGSRTECLKAWLSQAGWMTAPVSFAEETQARDLLQTCFASFTAKETRDIPCDQFTFIQNLREFVQTATVPARAKRGESVRLCKLRDAADLRAEHVFIIGMTAANIPSLESTLSPFSVKETAELCRRPDNTPFSLSEQLYRQEEQSFAAALQTATVSLTVSCHLSDGSSNTSPSSFLTRLGEPQAPVQRTITHSVWYDQIEAGTAVRNQEPLSRPLLGLHDPEETLRIVGRELCGYGSDFSTSPVRDVFAESYKDHVFSATEIETYLTCPYQWYLKMFVHLQNPSDKYSETTNFGSLVHAGLRRFFQNHGKELDKYSKETAEEGIVDSVRTAFNHYPFISSPSWSAKISWLLGDVYDGQESAFAAFAETEVGYAQNGWFSIPAVEDPETGAILKPGDLECDIPNVRITYKDESMTVKGSIDRVMRHMDGSFRIVDYKTGDGFLRDLPRLVQIPLYTEAFAAMHPELKPQGGYYFCLKAGKSYGVRPPNLKTGRTETESWETTRDRVLEMAFAAQRNMKQGIAPRNASCDPKFCPFSSICRRADREDAREDDA